MSNSILITGASGVLGRAIVSAFVEAGVTVRQGVRNLNSAKAGVPAVRWDYADPSTIAPALDGIDALLLMAPPLDAEAVAKLTPAIVAAKSAGLSHILLISAFGANYNEQAPLRVIEHLVIGSGIPYTILRPNFFMENFSEGFLAGSIKAQNGIFLAAGDGKTSFISIDDIAAVALAAFQKPLTGVELDLTGPESLDHTEAAGFISEAAGRPVAYHALTEEQMAAGARAAGLPESTIAYMAVLYSIVRGGFAAGITPVVGEVTGRPPLTFAEFARRNAAAWR
ncbi:SDR family oxidoreductase [Paludibaculum fermentans]|uniref:SDR family oxidoreductase n=1 Tax=Paludibaculum fermentans TaxID=1473598 RepID=A0A7S7SMP7_PALFE|nr:SDR family oxidoreductase [Paludibaculum fermentans]QOY90158.1 SDR family oxidoreductase [Paludibaculum fermentans]